MMPAYSDTNQCDACLNRVHPLFRHLSDSEYEELSFNKISDSYKRGSIVYQEGQRIKGCFCVQSGVVKIYKTGFDGKMQIVRFAKAGDLIGYRSVISNEAACSTTEILEEAVLCQIPGDFLIGLIKNNGNFAVELMKLTCKELGEANTYLTDVAQKTVRERLAEVLLYLNQEFGTDSNGFLKIILTREELANLVGTATESIIRLLSEYKSDGMIELKGRKIKILDRPGIRKIANI